MSSRRESAVDGARVMPGSAPSLAALLGDGRLGAVAGLVAAAADELIDEIARNGRPSSARVEKLVRRLAAEAAVDLPEARALLYLSSIRDPRRLSLPVQRAVEAVVWLCCALGPVEAASLWLRGPDGKLVEVASSGDSAATRTVRAAAAGAIAGNGGTSGARRNVHAVAISTRPAALAYRCRPADTGSASAYAHEGAATLALLFLVDELLSQSADRERSLVESGERRLVRVGFDLHDGPMQDIAALAQDVRLFRAQLASILADHDHEAIALGRVSSTRCGGGAPGVVGSRAGDHAG